VKRKELVKNINAAKPKRPANYQPPVAIQLDFVRAVEGLVRVKPERDATEKSG
jgi:hypothetical protein